MHTKPNDIAVYGPHLRVEAVERSLGRVLVHRSNDGTQLDIDALRLVALEGLELGLPHS